MFSLFVEKLSVFMLCGFLSAFIIPAIFVNLLFRLPRFISLFRKEMASGRQLVRIITEVLLWVVLLGGIYAAVYFVKEELFWQITTSKIAIFWWVLSIFFVALRLYAAYRKEWRKQKMERLESVHKLPIGQILLEAKVITESQLEKAILRQKQQNVFLGEVLLESDIISTKELDNFLAQQAELKRNAQPGREAQNILLGEMLVEAKVITEAQLEAALAYQKEHGGMLGEALISIKCIHEKFLKQILDVQAILDNSNIRPERAGHLVKGIIDNRDGNIGEILYYGGMITNSQLEWALKKQKESGKRVGEILVENEFVTQDLINMVLDVQALERGTAQMRSES